MCLSFRGKRQHVSHLLPVLSSCASLGFCQSLFQASPALRTFPRTAGFVSLDKRRNRNCMSLLPGFLSRVTPFHILQLAFHFLKIWNTGPLKYCTSKLGLFEFELTLLRLRGKALQGTPLPMNPWTATECIPRILTDFLHHLHDIYHLVRIPPCVSFGSLL